MTAPSQVPVRFFSGVSTDQVFQPLANFGQPNPAAYQTVFEDCFNNISATQLWIEYNGGVGAVIANAPGDGGLWKFTTVTAGGVVSIETAAAGFVLPPATYSGSGLTAVTYPSKKVFFAARINVTTVASMSWVAGLINQSATPTITPTDGIYFAASSATNMTLNAISGSTSQWSISIPAASLTNYANASWIDIAFYVDRLQNVYGFVGYPLFGFVPPQAWSGVNNTTAAPPPLGACVAYQTSVSGTWTPTTANLTPGLVFSGTAQTAYLDFIFAAKER